MFPLSVKRFFMPFLTGPGCTVSEDCPALNFPSIGQQCVDTVAIGGVNELYVIPCSETFSEENVTSAAWYQTLIDGAKFGRSGVILGSIAKLSDKKERIGSCRVEQQVSMTWGLKVQKKAFDLTSAQATVDQMNALLLNANRFLIIARLCEGDDTILPIGVFTAQDFNWTVPDNFEEVQVVEITLGWKELGMPKKYIVAGLSAVVPKLA